MAYIRLLRNIVDLISVWSSNSPMGITKNNLAKESIAPTMAIKNTLSTIVFTYTEKNVSPHNHRHKTKRNNEIATIFT